MEDELSLQNISNLLWQPVSGHSQGQGACNMPPIPNGDAGDDEVDQRGDTMPLAKGLVQGGNECLQGARMHTPTYTHGYNQDK